MLLKGCVDVILFNFYKFIIICEINSYEGAKISDKHLTSNAHLISLLHIHAHEGISC